MDAKKEAWSVHRKPNFMPKNKKSELPQKDKLYAKKQEK